MVFPPFGNEFLSPSKMLYWKVILFFIHLNKSIHVTLILDVSCQVVWCLMKSSWVWSGTSNWNATRKELIVFLQIFRTKECTCTGGQFKTFTGKMHSWKSWCYMCTFQLWNNPNETIFDQYIKMWCFKWW